MIYILVFIVQIIFMVKCFKHKLKWRVLLIFELISIFLALFLKNYYSSLPGYGFMPGLSYFSEIAISYISMIIYIIMFCITLFIKIILYLINKKKEGRDYFPIIKLIIRITGSIILVAGILYGGICTIHNYNIGKTSARVIDNVISESKWYYPVVQYIVNGTTYTTTNTKISSMQEFTINGETMVYYNKSNPNELKTVAVHLEIPFLILGGFMFIISMIGKNKKV